VEPALGLGVHHLTIVAPLAHARTPQSGSQARRHRQARSSSWRPEIPTAGTSHPPWAMLSARPVLPRGESRSPFPRPPSPGVEPRAQSPYLPHQRRARNPPPPEHDSRRRCASVVAGRPRSPAGRPTTNHLVDHRRVRRGSVTRRSTCTITDQDPARRRNIEAVFGGSPGDVVLSRHVAAVRRSRQLRPRPRVMLPSDPMTYLNYTATAGFQNRMASCGRVRRPIGGGQLDVPARPELGRACSPSRLAARAAAGTVKTPPGPGARAVARRQAESPRAR